ncbi:hypothetical protein Emed_004461 [Eimeria media]
MLMPLQSAYRPLWHDNRFGYSVRIPPRALKESADQETSTFVTSLSPQPQEKGDPPSSSATKDTNKQETGRQDSNNLFERKSNAQKQQGRQPQAASLRLRRRLTKVEDGEGSRLSERQQETGVPESLSLQGEKGVNANLSRGQGSKFSRRLDGTDFIPGCWELYCPLDPPPKLEGEKKKKKKEDKKKDDKKKDDKKDPKKDDKKDPKKDDKKDPKKDDKKDPKKDDKKDPKKDDKKDPKKDDKKPDPKKPDSPSKPTKDEQKKPGPGQGDAKGQKKTKGGGETTPGSPGAAKPPKPGESETGGSSKIKRTGGGFSKSQGTAISVQQAEGGRGETTGSTAQETDANANAPGSPPSGRQQSRTSRPPSDRRSERAETSAPDTQRGENAGEEREAQPGRRSEPSRQRPGSRRRPGDRNENVRPQEQNTDTDDEGNNRGGSRTTQTQQGRPQQALRRAPAPARAQGRGAETEDAPSRALEEDEETEKEEEEDADEVKRRSEDSTERRQTTQRSNFQPRGRPRPPQTQPTRSRQERTRETETDDDDDDNDDDDDDDEERSGDLTSHISGRRLQPEPEQGEEVQSWHQRDSTEARSSVGATSLHARRLNQTRLPYAYFIMAVNQWRYIHDPVHLLREETASDRAQEQAALRHNPPLEQVGYLDPRMGVFGPPTRAGPQLYRHDLKDKKKPTTSPLKIRETPLCYRQERKRPLVICPPGFTPNKEGGCYMLIAPEFTCLAVGDRQHRGSLAGRAPQQQSRPSQRRGSSS